MPAVPAPAGMMPGRTCPPLPMASQYPPTEDGDFWVYGPGRLTMTCGTAIALLSYSPALDMKRSEERLAHQDTVAWLVKTVGLSRLGWRTRLAFRARPSIAGRTGYPIRRRHWARLAGAADVLRRALAALAVPTECANGWIARRDRRTHGRICWRPGSSTLRGHWPCPQAHTKSLPRTSLTPLAKHSRPHGERPTRTGLMNWPKSERWQNWAGTPSITTPRTTQANGQPARRRHRRSARRPRMASGRLRPGGGRGFGAISEALQRRMRRARVPPHQGPGTPGGREPACDLERPTSVEPFAELLVCSKQRRSYLPKIAHSPRSFVVDEESGLVANAKYRVLLDKAVLLDSPARPWPSSDARLHMFEKWLGARYDRPGFSDLAKTEVVQPLQRAYAALVRTCRFLCARLAPCEKFASWYAGLAPRWPMAGSVTRPTLTPRQAGTQSMSWRRLSSPR